MNKPVTITPPENLTNIVDIMTYKSACLGAIIALPNHYISAPAILLSNLHLPDVNKKVEALMHFAMSQVDKFDTRHRGLHKSFLLNDSDVSRFDLINFVSTSMTSYCYLGIDAMDVGLNLLNRRSGADATPNRYYNPKAFKVLHDLRGCCPGATSKVVTSRGDNRYVIVPQNSNVDAMIYLSPGAHAPYVRDWILGESPLSAIAIVGTRREDSDYDIDTAQSVINSVVRRSGAGSESRTRVCVEFTDGLLSVINRYRHTTYKKLYGGKGLSTVLEGRMRRMMESCSPYTIFSFCLDVIVRNVVYESLHHDPDVTNITLGVEYVDAIERTMCLVVESTFGLNACARKCSNIGNSKSDANLKDLSDAMDGYDIQSLELLYKGMKTGTRANIKKLVNQSSEFRLERDIINPDTQRKVSLAIVRNNTQNE